MKRPFDVVVAIVALPLTIPFIPFLRACRQVAHPRLARRSCASSVSGGTKARSPASKLRTMCTNTPQVPTHETGNAAVTPIGHFQAPEARRTAAALQHHGRDMSCRPRPCLPTGHAFDPRRPPIRVVGDTSRITVSRRCGASTCPTLNDWQRSMPLISKTCRSALI